MKLLLFNARTPETNRAYKASQEVWRAYCEVYGVEVLDGDQRTLVTYVAFLFQESEIKYSTVKTRLAAVKALHESHLCFKPRGPMSVLTNVLKGFRRLRDRKFASEPLTLGIIKKIVKTYPKDELRDTVECVLAVGFWGLFRVGELVATKSNRASKHTMLMQNVSWRTRNHRVVSMVVRLPTCKSNKFGDKIHRVVMTCTCKVGLCPVHLTWKLLKTYSGKVVRGPVFRWADDTFVTGGELNKLIKKGCRELKLPVKKFSAKCLRSGGASYMEQNGMALRMIQKLGRWSEGSKTFQNFYSKAIVGTIEAFLERHMAQVSEPRARVHMAGVTRTSNPSTTSSERRRRG